MLFKVTLTISSATTLKLNEDTSIKDINSQVVTIA